MNHTHIKYNVPYISYKINYIMNIDNDINNNIKNIPRFYEEINKNI